MTLKARVVSSQPDYEATGATLFVESVKGETLYEVHIHAVGSAAKFSIADPAVIDPCRRDLITVRDAVLAVLDGLLIESEIKPITNDGPVKIAMSPSYVWVW